MFLLLKGFNMKTDAVIKEEGFKALREKLDAVEFERFIALINRDRFDYTKWRKNLFNDMELKELAEKADEFSRKL